MSHNWPQHGNTNLHSFNIHSRGVCATCVGARRSTSWDIDREGSKRRVQKIHSGIRGRVRGSAGASYRDKWTTGCGRVRVS